MTDDQSFDGNCPTCGQAYHGDDARELTRWRAMFSTPEIAQGAIDRMKASLDRIEATTAINDALLRKLAERA